MSDFLSGIPIHVATAKAPLPNSTLRDRVTKLRIGLPGKMAWRSLDIVVEEEEEVDVGFM